MTRKESAVAFLKMAGFGETEDAFARFIAPNFVHHNQYFRGDRESLKLAMAEAHDSLVVRGNPSDPDVAVVHIFKFKGDKVVELWDLGQLLSKDSPNENGAF